MCPFYNKSYSIIVPVMMEEALEYLEKRKVSLQEGCEQEFEGSKFVK